MKVQSYALEQSTKQLRKETEQLKKENARLSELDPSERNARRIQDVISLLEEYGGIA